MVAEKAFAHVQQAFIIKRSQTRNRRDLLAPGKGSLGNLTAAASVTVNGGVFPLRAVSKTLQLKVLAREIRQEEETHGIQTGKEAVQTLSIRP